MMMGAVVLLKAAAHTLLPAASVAIDSVASSVLPILQNFVTDQSVLICFKKSTE